MKSLADVSHCHPEHIRGDNRGDPSLHSVPLRMTNRAILNRYRRVLCVALLIFAGTLTGIAQHSLVNFAHLRHLTERILFEGDTVSIVHVYANYPDYEWVDAKESGPEGIACVDDAARAAVVYLRHFELFHDSLSMSEGTSLLKFVLKMETEDGMFYNFIFADHTINRNGKTSYASFGWWGSRGVWAMATGYKIFKEIDTAFAARLRNGIDRTLPHIDSLMRTYGRYDTLKGYRVPSWLLYESGADVTSELLLGLTTYFGVTRDNHLRQLIRNFTDGLMIMQNGDSRTYPFGLHRSWQTMWHMWGNGQTQALASAGKTLKKKELIASAEREATGFYSRLLLNGFMKEMDVSDTAKSVRYEQIAYAVRPMAVGLIRLYEATNNPAYLKLAGLAAAWFFGNNPAGATMYDSTTGRCFDGIRDSTTINKNSGAESTIEALHTLVELQHYPAAMKLLNFRRVRTGGSAKSLYAVFQNPQGNAVTLVLDLKKSKVLVPDGDLSRKYDAGK